MGKPAKLTKYTYSGDRFDNVLDGSSLAAELQARGLNVNGNDGNDTLMGGFGQDILSGGNGNDYLVANLDDLVGVSAGTTVYDGGAGSDTLDLSGLAYAEGSGIWIQYSAGAKSTNVIRTDVEYTRRSFDIDPVSFSESYSNNLKGIENFILTDGNDILQLLTPTGNNVIEGRGGDDHILAGDGADFVDGGTGDDLISGGWGNDRLTGGQGNDVFAIQGRIVGEYARDTITDFDTLSGPGDSSHDELWLWGNWTLDWDENSPSVLHAYVLDNGVVFGDITFEGLTLADAPNIVVLGIDPMTGSPF